MTDNFQPFLKPRLRLFLSADIVGSTAHKQNVVLLTEDYVKRNLAEQQLLRKFEALTPPWLSPITKLYRQVDRLFSQRWKAYLSIAEKIGWPSGDPPEFWKVNGDEIIYTKVLSDHRQAFACVHLWSETIRQYRKDLRTEFKTLDIKATGWLAGFPISNSEVIIRNEVGRIDPLDTGDDVFYNFYLLEKYYSGSEEDKHSLTRDFIGPSIDTGFRLSTLSTPRKFTISVELALLLVSVTAPVATFRPLPVRYDGRTQLKGVLGGRPYPVFWVDLLHDDDLLAAEDKLHPPNNPGEENVRHFCEKFLLEHEENLIRPFIYENIDPNFSVIPDIYRKRLEKLSSDWPVAKQHKEIEIKAISNEEGPSVETITTPADAQLEALNIPHAEKPNTPSDPALAATDPA
jgi:hypothetical protein